MKRMTSLVIVIVAVMSQACSSATGSPATEAPASGASTTAAPSIATTSPIDGTWSGPVLTIAQAKKFVPQKYRARVFGPIIRAGKSVQFQLRIGDGRLTQVEVDDRHDTTIGQAGNITIDGHLIHMLDDSGAVYTYRWDASPGSLHLEVVRITGAFPTDGVPDRVFQHLIYESQPLTKES